MPVESDGDLMQSVIRTLMLVLAVSMLNAIGMLPTHTYARMYINQPEYAKWGLIAVEQSKAKYHAEIMDYLHVGRKEVSPGVAEETFKLWLRDRTREYGVIVTIQFYTANDQIITVKFQETAN